MHWTLSSGEWKSDFVRWKLNFWMEAARSSASLCFLILIMADIDVQILPACNSSVLVLRGSGLNKLLSHVVDGKLAIEKQLNI